MKQKNYPRKFSTLLALFAFVLASGLAIFSPYDVGKARISISSKAFAQTSGQLKREAQIACEKSTEGTGLTAPDFQEYCERGYIGAKQGKSQEVACIGARSNPNGIGGGQKDYCESGYGLAGGGSTVREDVANQGGRVENKDGENIADEIAANSTEDPESELADCDIKWHNPMSWIICPLIDIGASLTDTVFQDIVKPLLSDVPVSTNRNDPIYQVWQGFRLIANVMLVGAMLAIVYAQSKGGGS